jgi:two-component system sensor histidine kinase YesM
LLALIAKYFAIVLSPVVVLALLGYVSVFATRQYAGEQMERLASTSLYQLESISDHFLSEVQATALATGTATPLLRTVRAHLESSHVGLEELRELELVRNVVNTAAHARPHVQSIYIYLDGFDAVLNSDTGIIDRAVMKDSSWWPPYANAPPEVETWVARRDYTPLGESGPRESVISLYQRLFTLTARDIEGVVVLNVRESAVRNVLRSAALSSQHRFVVHDADGNVITSDLDDAEFARAAIMAAEAGERSFVRNGTEYMVNESVSSDSGWKYIMVTPRSVYFEPVNGMVRLSFSMVSIAVLSGLGIAVAMAARSMRYIREVFDIIERAESGRDLPSIREHPTTGFSYITYHVLRAFAERQYYQLRLSERAYRQKTLELQALQSQMNPHFLFNTLEALNWQILAESGRPGQANEMVESLSQILKYGLRHPTRYVQLGEEMENASHYLRLQSIRHEAGFRIRFDVPHPLERTAMVPMTLQPLVENCVVHGFTDRCEGSITVKAWKSAPRLLRLRVEDDGRGMPADELRELREAIEKVRPGSNGHGIEDVSEPGASPGEAADGHIGLVNTVRRLSLAFDAVIPVTLTTHDDAGFVVEFEMPFRLLKSRDRKTSGQGHR